MSLSVDSSLGAFRTRLRGGNVQFGMFTRLSDPEIMSSLAAASLDFVVIDVEHAALGKAEIKTLLTAARSVRLPALLRVPVTEPRWILFALASGAAGVILTHVVDAAIAAEVARYARTTAVELSYAAMGINTAYRAMPYDTYRREACERFAVMLQPDTATAQQAWASICEVQGIDGLFIASLSMALAYGEPDTRAGDMPKILEACCSLCVEHHVPMALNVIDAAELSAWQSRGVRMFVVGSDFNVLRKGAADIVSTLRAVNG